MLNNKNINILYSIVLKHCKVTTEEFQSSCRRQNIITARAMFSYLLRKHKYTFQKIGEIINMSHCNIIAYCDNIEGYLKFSADYRILYNKINNEFNKYLKNEK